MKKKEKPSLTDEEEAEREKCLEMLATAFAEDLFAKQKMALEPFEAYLQKIKLSLYADADQFRTRFSRGYRILLEELESKK